MEQQAVRRKRRRRRRRSKRAWSESIAWVSLVFSLGQRAYHWVGLILILTVILYIGMFQPVITPLRLMDWWGHW